MYPSISRSKLPHIDSDREEDEEGEINAADEVDQVDEEQLPKSRSGSKSNLKNNLSLSAGKLAPKSRSKLDSEKRWSKNVHKSAIVSITNGPKVETVQSVGIWTPIYKKTRNETKKVLTYFNSSSKVSKMVTTNNVRSLPFDSNTANNSVTLPLLINGSSNNITTDSLVPSTSAPVVATISSTMISTSSRSMLQSSTTATTSSGKVTGQTSAI